MNRYSDGPLLFKKREEKLFHLAYFLRGKMEIATKIFFQTPETN